VLGKYLTQVNSLCGFYRVLVFEAQLDKTCHDSDVQYIFSPSHSKAHSEQLLGARNAARVVRSTEATDIKNVAYDSKLMQVVTDC